MNCQVATFGAERVARLASLDFITQKRKNPLSLNLTGFRNMAQWTGLEPAPPGGTGRYSNQLNYHCAILKRLGG